MDSISLNLLKVMEISNIEQKRKAIKRAEDLMDLEESNGLTQDQNTELEKLAESIDKFETELMNLD